MYRLGHENKVQVQIWRNFKITIIDKFIFSDFSGGVWIFPASAEII